MEASKAKSNSYFSSLPSDFVFFYLSFSIDARSLRIKNFSTDITHAHHKVAIMKVAPQNLQSMKQKTSFLISFAGAKHKKKAKEKFTFNLEPIVGFFFFSFFSSLVLILFSSHFSRKRCVEKHSSLLCCATSAAAL
jgi:hypothetical protein